MARNHFQELSRILIVLALCCILLSPAFAAEQPVGPNRIVNKSTETAPVRSAYLLNTSGGTFTTLLINITAQTYRWKAYAGNVTGKLTLDDNLNYTIYDWNIASVAGEVYATRKSSIVQWSSIRCANKSTIRTEEIRLNISSANDDGINRTFMSSSLSHDEFYVATTRFAAGTCKSIATYVNSTSQAAKFQEVALYDSSYIVYAGLLENKQRGFDNNYYDFQLILPESGLEAQQAPTAYYFYVELS